MQKYIVIQGDVHQFNEDDPNIPPLVAAGALERCNPDGSDIPAPEGTDPFEPKAAVEERDDDPERHYRLTKTRNFTVHETEDLIKALMEN